MVDTKQSRAHCYAQAMRLGSVEYTPDHVTAELADALRGAFDSPEEAKAAVDEMVLWEHRPTPGEIWHFAHQQKEHPLPWCERCDGTGWLSSDEDVYSEVACGTIRVGVSRSCTCRKGGS